MRCTGKVPAKVVGAEDKHGTKAAGWAAAEERQGAFGMFECAAFLDRYKARRINSSGELSTTTHVQRSANE